MQTHCWFKRSKILRGTRNSTDIHFLVNNLARALMSRVFTTGPGDRGSIPKTQKMLLDAALLNTQNYKVRIKGKVEQSREMSSAFPYTLV